jgi:acyl carrier protein
MKNKLIEIFNDVLREEFDISELKSSNDAWDSVANLNLILAIEEEFGIEIPPSDFPEIYSDFQSVLEYIDKK